MLSSGWGFMLAYAQAKLTYYKILRGLYKPAKHLEETIYRVLKNDQQREFDTYRKEARKNPLRRNYGEEPQTVRPSVGLDFKEITTGFIKVDGVWRDLQYHISLYRHHSKPERALPADSLSQVAAYIRRLSRTAYMALTRVQRNDAELHSSINSLPMDQPFTNWED